MPLRENDYVIAVNNIFDIPQRSVGLVRGIRANKVLVFFIGPGKDLEVDINQIRVIDLNQTGKPHKYKICNRCHILKERLVDFEINQTDAKGRKTTRPSCRQCRKDIDRTSMPASEKAKMEAIKPKYLFTCPICHKTTIPGVTANLVIDHDHDTGEAREWICDSCNTGLGRFHDDVSCFEGAIEYLKKFEK